MGDLGKGLLAGFVATIVISMIMVLRLSTGIMSWYNPVEIMNLSVQHLFGAADSDITGWGTHFFVGTVIWGLLFGVLVPRLPADSYTRKGLIFGVGAWLLIMVTLFPLAGSGFFALGFGVIVPLTTLITHLIYGAVLGWTYGWLMSL